MGADAAPGEQNPSPVQKKRFSKTYMKNVRPIAMKSSFRQCIEAQKAVERTLHDMRERHVEEEARSPEKERTKRSGSKSRHSPVSVGSAKKAAKGALAAGAPQAPPHLGTPQKMQTHDKDEHLSAGDDEVLTQRAAELHALTDDTTIDPLLFSVEDAASVPVTFITSDSILQCDNWVGITAKKASATRYPITDVALAQNAAKALKSCTHPNIPPFVGCCLTRDTKEVFVATDRIDGGTLKEAIKTTGAFSVEQLLWSVKCVARALRCLHTKKVAHGSLTANCFFLASDLRIMLGCFETAVTSASPEQMAEDVSALVSAAGTLAELAPASEEEDLLADTLAQLQTASGSGDIADILALDIVSNTASSSLRPLLTAAAQAQAATKAAAVAAAATATA